MIETYRVNRHSGYGEPKTYYSRPSVDAISFGQNSLKRIIIVHVSLLPKLFVFVLGNLKLELTLNPNQP